MYRQNINLLILFIMCSFFTFAQSGLSSYKIPQWLVKADTNLQWMQQKKQEDIKMKHNIIKKIKSKSPNIKGVIKYHNLPPDSLVKMSFMIDINHDSIDDFIFYDYLPFCNEQAFVIIAVSKNNSYEIILEKECEFLSWYSRDDSLSFQIYVQGCCEDYHGYMYSILSIKGGEESLYLQLMQVKNRQLFTSTNPEIIWKSSTHIPMQHQTIAKAEITKDSVYLKHNPEEIRGVMVFFMQNSPQWFLYAGDSAEVLQEKTVNQKKWYYLKTPINKRNMPESYLQGSFVYGWIQENNVLLK